MAFTKKVPFDTIFAYQLIKRQERALPAVILPEKKGNEKNVNFCTNFFTWKKWFVIIFTMLFCLYRSLTKKSDPHDT